jgi:hypothetical protein
MLCTRGELIDSVLVDNLMLNFKRSTLILLVSIEQHVVHAETPRVELILVPAIDEL